MAQSYSLNERAVERATELIEARQDVLDRTRTHPPELQPRAANENAFLETHSWEEYAARRVQRSAIIACHYRAAEWRHKEIELAAHELLQVLDAKSG